VYTNNQVGDSGSYPDYFLGDYGDNPLWFYQQYNSTNSVQGGTSELAIRGAVTPWQTDAGAPPISKTHAEYVLSSFIDDVKGGTLPQVSWITPPNGYDEHPPSPPALGMWFSHQVISALVSNPKIWSKTVLFIMYDENDGFFDHVVPPTPPPGTPGEYLTADPLPPGAFGITGPIGLGFRVPMLVVSPFSRGGYVCSETFDHTSQLRFLEARFGVKAPNISAWRRSVTGDLTATLHVTSPDTSVPALPATAGTADPRVLSECTAGQLVEVDVSNPTPYPVPTDQRIPDQEPGAARRVTV